MVARLDLYEEVEDGGEVWDECLPHPVRLARAAEVDLTQHHLHHLRAEATPIHVLRALNPNPNSALDPSEKRGMENLEEAAVAPLKKNLGVSVEDAATAGEQFAITVLRTALLPCRLEILKSGERAVELANLTSKSGNGGSVQLFFSCETRSSRSLDWALRVTRIWTYERRTLGDFHNPVYALVGPGADGSESCSSDTGLDSVRGVARGGGSGGSGPPPKSGEGGVRGSGAEAGGGRCQKCARRAQIYKFFSRFARIIPEITTILLKMAQFFSKTRIFFSSEFSRHVMKASHPSSTLNPEYLGSGLDPQLSALLRADALTGEGEL